MPAAHRRTAAWSVERFRREARAIGTHTEALIAAILAGRPHPEQGFLTCVGVLKLIRGSNRQRAEAVCERARAIGTHTYKSVASILKKGLDNRPSTASHPAPVFRHDKIRVPGYYQ